MDENQHRTRRGRCFRNEDIEQVALGRAVFDVPLHLDALIGLLLLQRRVERGGLGRVDDAAEFLQFGGDFRRHRAILSPCRGYEHGGKNRQSRFK